MVFWIQTALHSNPKLWHLTLAGCTPIKVLLALQRLLPSLAVSPARGHGGEGPLISSEFLLPEKVHDRGDWGRLNHKRLTLTLNLTLAPNP